MATTRARQDEQERLRTEQGNRFLQQMADMFKETRSDLAAQFIPRGEGDARFDHLEQIVANIGTAMEKLTGNVATFHESVPRIYAERAEMREADAELRTEIEKLKTAREADMQRGYGSRIEDMQGRYGGEASLERGWRTNAQQQSNLALGWIIGGAFVLASVAVSIILALALRH